LIDKEIIENCRNGNLQEFRKLVDASSPFAFSVAFRMVGDEVLASDIVQETMITIWKSITKINSSEGFKMWVYRIVLNKCYDELRKRKRNREFIADDKTWKSISEKVYHNPEVQLENIEIAGLIKALTGKLSPKQKAVFILSDLDDMTNEEISGITGMSRTVIKANLYYARKRIGEMIEKYL
jgi:RNA polymerase sigma-70 factor (ECF subfamily)